MLPDRKRIERLRNRTIKYVLKRKCRNGGFCFYRLDEPNASDTYYALSVLNLLNVDFNDDRTVEYLKKIHSADGGYQGIYSAHYSIEALLLLGEKPEYNIEEYLKRNLQIYSVENLPAGGASIFRKFYYLTDLCHSLKIGIWRKTTDRITEFVLNFRRMDNGFGYTRSTLMETFHALSILEILSYRIEKLNTQEFIKSCENQTYGIVNLPNTTPAFVEHIYSGLMLSKKLDYNLRYPEKCIRFLLNCQNKNGGFSRSISGGISTLENTYYAVHSLSLQSILY